MKVHTVSFTKPSILRYHPYRSSHTFLSFCSTNFEVSVLNLSTNFCSRVFGVFSVVLIGALFQLWGSFWCGEMRVALLMFLKLGNIRIIKLFGVLGWRFHIDMQYHFVAISCDDGDFNANTAISMFGMG